MRFIHPLPLLTVLLTVLLTILLTSGAAAESFDHAQWNRLLERHVITTGNAAVTVVDYAGMQKESAALAQYLSQLAGIQREQFDRWPEEAQLAFLLNAYNAWTVKLILGHYPGLDSIRDLGSLLQSPWQKKFIDLLGSNLSLDDIEHALIRRSGRYNEPRIHFAVNCASIGCPALRAEAYTEAQLEQQLEEQTRLFLGDRERNRLRGSALEVSPLFKWYREDFERGWQGFESIYQFFAAYSDALGLNTGVIDGLQSGKIALQYTDYDWRLNTADHAAARD